MNPPVGQNITNDTAILGLPSETARLSVTKCSMKCYVDRLCRMGSFACYYQDGYLRASIHDAELDLRSSCSEDSRQKVFKNSTENVSRHVAPHTIRLTVIPRKNIRDILQRPPTDYARSGRQRRHEYYG